MLLNLSHRACFFNNKKRGLNLFDKLTSEYPMRVEHANQAPRNQNLASEERRKIATNESTVNPKYSINTFSIDL